MKLKRNGRVERGKKKLVGHTRSMVHRCRYVSGFEQAGICAYKGRTEVAKTTRWKAMGWER